MGFPCDSTSKESACNLGDLGSIPGLGRFPWRRERLPTPVFWPGEFQGLYSLSSVHYSCSVVSNSLWAMDRSTPGLPVHHLLLEFTHTHAHWVGAAIQPSHTLFSPSPPAFSLQSFSASVSFQMNQPFTLGGQSIGVSTSTSVLPMNIQDYGVSKSWTRLRDFHFHYFSPICLCYNGLRVIMYVSVSCSTAIISRFPYHSHVYSCLLMNWFLFSWNSIAKLSGI